VALSFGEMLDRCFDGFYGHMQSLSLLSHECKSESGRLSLQASSVLISKTGPYVTMA
jgi:hypothetical protein